MDEDELPPWLGAAFEDAFHAIFFNQQHAESADQEPSHEHRD